jgi:hypothetical protein
MTKRTLLAAAAAFTLFATPAFARPMTATDMHMMHRLGAPEVSPDGRWAVFTISETDLPNNKRNNTLYLLDLKAKAAAPQPVKGAEKGHDAAFAADGSIWFIMEANAQDQLFRLVPGGAPTQVSSFKGEIAGFKLAPSGDRLVIWGDRDLRCTDFACEGLPKKAETGSARTYDQLFIRHWDTWAQPGVRSRLFGFAVQGGKVAGAGVPLTGALVGDTPSKPFGAGEEIAFSPDGKTIFFTLREAGRIEATSTNLDIFSTPSDGSAAPVNLTDANDGMDNLPAVSPDGRTLAYFAMARPTYEADRQVLTPARSRHRPGPRTDPGLGPLDRQHRLGAGRQEPAGHRRRHAGRTGVPRRRPYRQGHAPDQGWPCRQRQTASQWGRTLHVELGARAGRPVPRHVERPNQPADPCQQRPAGRDRPGNARPLQLRRRQWRQGLGHQGQAGQGDRGQAADRLPRPRRPAGQLRQQLVLSLESAAFRVAGLCRDRDRFHGSTGYGQAFTDAIRSDWGGKPLEDLQKGLAYATANDPSSTRTTPVPSARPMAAS